MKTINLDNVQEFAKFKNPVGGFICEIKTVEDVPDKEYLKLGYDIVEAVTEDQKEFVGMYAKRKAERDFDYPITIASYKESSLPFFKGFVTALESSNDGYRWDNDEKKFIGKRIGLVIGEEEYEGQDKNGAPKIKVRTYVAEKRSVQSIKEGDFDVPEFKKLAQGIVERKPNPFATSKTSETTETFDSIPAFAAVDDDSCPF